MHERIEQWNCKGRVAVVGTPDHTLRYQLIARRAKRVNWSSERFRNVARAMGPGSEFGHGAQVAFFRRRESIKTDTKEALVECSNRSDRGYLDIVRRDMIFTYAREKINFVRSLLQFFASSRSRFLAKIDSPVVRPIAGKSAGGTCLSPSRLSWQCPA